MEEDPKPVVYDSISKVRKWEEDRAESRKEDVKVKTFQHVKELSTRVATLEFRLDEIERALKTALEQNERPTTKLARVPKKQSA